jgi:hypothetical protein
MGNLYTAKDIQNITKHCWNSNNNNNNNKQVNFKQILFGVKQKIPAIQAYRNLLWYYMYTA